MENESKTPLLDAQEEVKGQQSHKQHPPRQPARLVAFAISQLVFLAVYTTILFLLFRSPKSESCGESTLVWSPAREAVVPERKLIEGTFGTDNVYKGHPSNETDDAWNELFRYANIRLSQDELNILNTTSTELRDSSGEFLGTLDVYHELHCVNYIRQFVHNDYYNLPIVKIPHIDHVDHCIDMLRQLVMCKGDISVLTYSWHPIFGIPWPNFALEHECRNWDSINTWSKEHAILEEDLSIVLRPTQNSER